MNEFKSLTNKQLQEMYMRSHIAINSITKSMAKNDAQYLRHRHHQLGLELDRRVDQDMRNILKGQ